MIRHLLFSWEAWVVYYGSVGIGWGVVKTIRHGKNEEIKEISPRPAPNPEQDYRPKEAPTFEANYDASEDVFQISQPTKPGWMR